MNKTEETEEAVVKIPHNGCYCTMGYVRTSVSTGAVYPALLSFSPHGSYETPGGNNSDVDTEAYFLTVWAGLAES